MTKRVTEPCPPGRTPGSAGPELVLWEMSHIEFKHLLDVNVSISY